MSHFSIIEHFRYCLINKNQVFSQGILKSSFCVYLFGLEALTSLQVRVFFIPLVRGAPEITQSWQKGFWASIGVGYCLLRMDWWHKAQLNKKPRTENQSGAFVVQQ